MQSNSGLRVFPACFTVAARRLGFDAIELRAEGVPGMWMAVVARRLEFDFIELRLGLGARRGRSDLSAGLIDPVFGDDTETVGDAVDVVEVRANLGGVVDGAVIPTRRTQIVDICRITQLRGDGQLLGVRQQRGGRTIQTCGAPVGGKAVNHLLVFGAVGNLRPEVIQVCAYSVVAFVGLGGHHRDHLSLSSTQRRVGEHRCRVHPHRVTHDGAVLAHYGNDVPDAAGPAHR